LAWSQIQLGDQPGENLIKVSSEGLEGSPLYFSATGEVGQPVSMMTVSGHPQTGPAGQQLPDPLIVGVIDSDGDPVANVVVQWEVEVGGGRLLTPAVVATDAFGYSRALFKNDNVAGRNSWVKASNNLLSGSPRRFSVTSTAGNPSQLAQVSGDGQSGFVGQQLNNPLVVKVSDPFGNPVSGYSVRFVVVSGGATIQGGQEADVLTNASGLASTLVRLGQTTGTVVIEARGQYLDGSPVRFSLTVQSNVAQDIVLFSGNNQIGTVGQILVDPLRVRVVDAFGNPVSGVSVFFSRDAGPGSIIETQPVVSDANGIAAVNFRVGSTPSTSVVSALWSNKMISFTVQAVTNPNFPVLDKTLIPESPDVSEGDALLITLYATDADSDPLTFQVGNLFPPDGAGIPDPTANPSQFRWTPNYTQQGTHDVVLRVVDGKGGVDSDTVTVNVQNVNQSPTILSTIPAGDTTVVSGQTLTLSVNAVDHDGDPLTYSWEVDGQPVSTTQSFYHHQIDKFFSGNRTVDVFVSDGVVIKSFRWVLTVRVSVELSMFMAQFEQEFNAVKVVWATSYETDNAGFDVYRSTTRDGDYVKINDTMIPSRSDGSYDYTDRTVDVGRTYFYKLIGNDFRGNRHEYGPVSVTITAPDKLVLDQNYPNPFNPITVIRYQLAKREQVMLSVYNIMGQRVATLVDEVKEPGFYTAEWNGYDDTGRDVSTGIYIYQLRTAKQVITKRMVKMK